MSLSIVATTLDCRGQRCPGPILATAKAAKTIGSVGGLLEISADDDAFPFDIRAWCRSSGAELLELVSDQGTFTAKVRINSAGSASATARTNVEAIRMCGRLLVKVGGKMWGECPPGNRADAAPIFHFGRSRHWAFRPPSHGAGPQAGATAPGGPVPVAARHDHGRYSARMSQNERWVPRPLAGVTVLELAQNLAGPYAAQILAALGADVIKGERPGGDAAREWGPPFVHGTGSIFAAANRGKRSVELDLASDDGRAALRALIARTDILIEAFRPGAFAAMGFDADTVLSWNPALIYCSVLAYGEYGPLRDLPGYDPLMQAHAGLMSITGEPGTRGARVGTSVVDMGTGMWLVIAVMAALRERDRTGSGTRLSVALYDTALAWNAYHIGGFLDAGAAPAPMGSELPMIAPYGAFETMDGEVMIAAGNDNLFRRLCNALSIDIGKDARFATNATRVQHRQDVNEVVRARTREHRADELLDLLRQYGVPCAPIQDIAQVSRDRQTRASDMISAGAGPTALRVPIRFDGERPAAGSPPPRSGEHTATILDELGELD